MQRNLLHMIKLLKALVAGRGRIAGTSHSDMIVAEGQARITRSRVIVRDSYSYAIFDKDAAQILQILERREEEE